MLPAPFAVLHVGLGLEVTFLEYLVRVLLHLSVLGGVAVLAFAGPRAIGSIRSAVRGGRDGDTDDR